MITATDPSGRPEHEAGAHMTRIMTISVTEAGRKLAELLPYEHHHGSLKDRVRALWDVADAFVLMASAGTAVRIVAPLLSGKDIDPAVVSVDDGGRHVISLVGGHHGRPPGPTANRLAREVASLLGAEAVISTASDVSDVPALDELPGFVAHGDIAALQAAMLDGVSLHVANPMKWPLPLRFKSLDTQSLQLRDIHGAVDVLVTDLSCSAVPSRVAGVVLHPLSLVAGIGASTQATAEEVGSLLEQAISSNGLSLASLAEVATIDRRREDPWVESLGLPTRFFPASALDKVNAPNPSRVVAEAVGSASVAEAAAMLAAGPGSSLVVEKRASKQVTVAIARRVKPRGELLLIGLGPGDPSHQTYEAASALGRAEVIVGYASYVDQVAARCRPGQSMERFQLGEEVRRVRRAVALAAEGRVVALLASGDPGIYALAGTALEVAGDTCTSCPASPDTTAHADHYSFDITMVPGVTASVAAASLLGAPLGHDHASISLSDLLTPWATIEQRIHAAASGDFAIAFYNPRSARRTWQLESARDILLQYRSPSTPVGVVTDAYRPGATVQLTTLGAFDPDVCTMGSCVIVGSSSTHTVGPWMVTPRGYSL